jgi:hypothetical protein
MDLALTVEFFFIVIFFRQVRYHLFEALVMHFGRIDVAAHDLRAECFGEVDTDVDGCVGMVGVIDRDIDRLIHRDVSSRCPPGQGERE